MAKQEVTLTIDGNQVIVPDGTLVVDAAKKIGIDIPVFCYHPKMEPVGMCRMCLVEVGRPVIDRATGQPALEADGSPKLQFGWKPETACTTPVSEGMVVLGMSETAKESQKGIIEFLLTSHPLDCPICDKGGECPLQNLTMTHGASESRFEFANKLKMDKRVPLGELIFLDRERCIQCGRCVRFQSDLAGDAVIEFSERGRSTEIITSSDPGFDSVFSGNTSDICPVGALTTTDFRFGARPWELKSEASICTQCPVGCNTVYNTRREVKSNGKVVIKRVMPRQNEMVNELWLCDKGRFAYHFAQSEDRLTKPIIRKDGALQEASWDEALQTASRHIGIAKSDVVVLAGGRLANEDLFNLKKLADGLGGKTVLYTHMGGGELTTQLGVGAGTNFSDMGKGTAIVVVASDLYQEAPIWYLRVKQAAERGATLIVANPRETKLEKYAPHVIRYAYGDEAVTIAGLLESTAAQSAAQALKSAENVVVLYGSEGMGLQASSALAAACGKLLVAAGQPGKPNNGLIGVWQKANEQGAWELGLRPQTDLTAALQNKIVYVVGADPAGDAPHLAQALRGAQSVIVQDLFLTETAKIADVVLPAQAQPEREGSYTSAERRVQRFYAALPPTTDSRPDFKIAAQLAALLGIELSVSADTVMEQIAAEVKSFAGINYARLAETTEQWPIVGRSDLYYGGTTYENTQGLGVQLAAGTESTAFSEAHARTALRPSEDEWLAVPFALLYDLGTSIAPSGLLAERIGAPRVILHPEAARRLGVSQVATINLNGQEYEVQIVLDETVLASVIMVPRSMGVPVIEPTVVTMISKRKEGKE